ncbi:12477_t:CDS:1 [Entrophospora sp. SA101]|nr:12477_t:CDS:1 [Entrophospora sp. SA101]
MARALVEKENKLTNNGDRNELDCVAYTNTAEVGVYFEVRGHFDLDIKNIATLGSYCRIRDCPRHIVSLFYQKNSNDLFRPPGCENIHTEYAVSWPDDLPTEIKGHRECDGTIISYKIDEFTICNNIH